MPNDSDHRTRRVAGCAACFLSLAIGLPTTAADFVLEARTPDIEATPTNLGPTTGYVGGGAGGFALIESGLTSADDVVASQTLFYGPDSFDQVNTGNYSLLQDFTAEATKIGFDLTQSSEAIGPASPQVNVVNTAELFFSTTDTETATLTFEYQGDTNVDVDTVVCRLRRVGTGDNPDVLDEIFTLAGMPRGSGSGTLPVELLAGERYQIFMDGRARSFNASSSTSSYVRLTITLPGCPADLADPIGTLNFFDLAAFIALYNAQDPAADLAEPMGTFNFFDVAAYLDAYNAGCP